MASFCPPISNVTDVEFVYGGGGSLDVNWTGFSPDDKYIMSYRERDTFTWTVVPVTSAVSTTTITGLTEGKRYEFRFVSLYCSDTRQTPPDYYAYTVPTSVAAPTNFRFNTAATATTAPLKWDDGTTGDYIVSVTDGTFMYIVNVTGALEVTIFDLDPTKLYKFFLGRVETDEIIDVDGYLEKTPLEGCCLE